jgi:hypothetical protein
VPVIRKRVIGCSICHEEFVPECINAKYCSDRCRCKATKAAKKIRNESNLRWQAEFGQLPRPYFAECTVCRRRYATCNHHAKYCSTECKRRAEDRLYGGDQTAVYVFSDRAANRVKIGVSKDPERRKRGLGLPDLEIVYSFTCATLSAAEHLERELHKHFHRFRLDGTEWFQCSPALNANNATAVVRDLIPGSEVER